MNAPPFAMGEITSGAGSKGHFYHDGTKYSRKQPGRNRDGSVKAPPMEEREVIAWDMEGMSLSGENKPQHPVLFGSSMYPADALQGKQLSTEEMLDAIIQTGSRHPFAIHVGYGFRYDANMILQGLSESLITRLWRENEARFGPWYIRWIPGKMFTVSKRNPGWTRATRKTKGNSVSVTIYDYSSFFGGSGFLDTCEQILKHDLSDSDREVIAHGKAARGHNQWEDYPEVLHYWKAEIQLIRRVFERFRDVMCRAGFTLKEWYGPGALANYINALHGLRARLVGVQFAGTGKYKGPGTMPEPVHNASKVAFSGGRFELFRAGRTMGPIQAVDINSAYPFALTMIPSFESGEWVHTMYPKRIARFGFYRIRFMARNTGPFEYRPMPLFWRDPRGMISYPAMAHGWYASPEARSVLGMPGVEILEGWEWETQNTELPWTFLREMYATRQRLGKSNLLSMPFKLGPNSLYGKYAQTVGWDRKKQLPPKSHALPVAAWITSFTRAQLWSIIRQIPSQVIAVETDSVYFQGDISDVTIDIGNGLGQWSHEEYDEISYLQSGMYHKKEHGEWTATRSRGIHASEYPIDVAQSYLESLVSQEWSPLRLQTRPRFIGAGAALNSNAPLKVLHCAWQRQTREYTLGETGKRRHAAKACAECKQHKTPWEEPHRLVIASKSDGEQLSHPRRLPWEQAHTTEVEAMRKADETESELVTR